MPREAFWPRESAVDYAGDFVCMYFGLFVLFLLCMWREREREREKEREKERRKRDKK